ncbi:MAG: PAS domain S-box protein, partial [Chloroflexi bacterium]|nr:PAS domain S-box protein [Chloroflexota bacterium]
FTGLDDEALALEAVRRGAQDYLVKGQLTGHALWRVIHYAIERKRAEEALRESEERFRVAQEMSPDGFTILHPLRNEKGEIVDFTWLYENQTIARLNGTDPEEVIGKRLLDLFPTHKGTPVFEAYIHVANTGNPQIIEEAYVGEILSKPIWLRLVVVSMGEDIAILAQDITERKQAEAEIMRSRQEWEDIFQAIGHPTLILNAQYQILDANLATVKAADRPRSELLGKKCYEVFHQTDKPANGCPMEKMLSSGHLETVEMEMEALHGTFMVSCTPVLDGNGRLQKIIHIATNITERKRAEEALQESERKFRDIVEHSGDIFYMFDLDAKPLYLSPQVLNILGYTPEEFAGIKWTGLLTDNPINRAGIRSTVAAIQTGEKQPP